MGKKITPPKTPTSWKKFIAKIAIFTGIFLLLVGTYKLYQLKGPTFNTEKIPAPTVEQNTLYSNTLKVTIKGKTIKKGKVIAYLNGRLLSETVADPLGYFELPASFKEDGIYKLQLRTFKNLGVKLLSKKSSLITVVIDRQPPKLQNIKIIKYANKLNVQGTLSENAKIFIHEGSTRLLEKELPKGDFNIDVLLSQSTKNYLYIFAMDKAGNTSKPLKITTIKNKQSSTRQNISHELPNSGGLADIAISAVKENIIVTYLLSLGLALYLSGILVKRK